MGRNHEGPAPYGVLLLLGQFSCNTFSPPFHTNVNRTRQTVFREGIEVNLLETLTSRQNHIAFVIIDRAGEHIEAGEQKDGSGNWTREITRAAGISDDFRPFHGHRHTFASTLASEGTDLYTIQILLTQKSRRMTKRYSHLRDESLRRAAEKASRVLNGNRVESQSKG